MLTDAPLLNTMHINSRRV